MDDNVTEFPITDEMKARQMKRVVDRNNQAFEDAKALNFESFLLVGITEDSPELTFMASGFNTAPEMLYVVEQFKKQLL